MSIGLKVLLVLVLMAIGFWFFNACYGWMVLVYPPFVAFPKWGFIILLYVLAK